MFAGLYSAALVGIKSYPILCEADISSGLPRCVVVGLPDAAVNEAQERIWAAFGNSGFEVPLCRIRINLAPGDIRKEGPRFDLAMALAVLAASGAEGITPEKASGWMVLGELAMDGSVRAVKGVLSALITAEKTGIKKVIIPYENLPEASFFKGIKCFGAVSLKHALGIIAGKEDSFIKFKSAEALPHAEYAEENELRSEAGNLKYVCGQKLARRGLEICAAGSHHMLMVGAPGSGKSMLAKCLPSIMPSLSEQEALEAAVIRTASGKAVSSLSDTPPFRQPVSSVSPAGLIGSLSPGEITLAHRGVLFLDEFPEFRRDCLEALRLPLENGIIEVSRAKIHISYPCRFVLIAAMNPCPCGFFGDSERSCSCTCSQRRRYLSRVSGPLIDRIDLQVHVSRPKSSELLGSTVCESSEEVKIRVEKAAEAQRLRGVRNGFMNSEQTRKYCMLDKESRRFIADMIERLSLSGRVKDRLCRCARTIADLEGSERIELIHVMEAMEYRSLDYLSASVSLRPAADKKPDVF